MEVEPEAKPLDGNTYRVKVPGPTVRGNAALNCTQLQLKIVHHGHRQCQESVESRVDNEFDFASRRLQDKGELDSSLQITVDSPADHTARLDLVGMKSGPKADPFNINLRVWVPRPQSVCGRG